MGEPTRTSTATSNTAPRVTHTSFPCAFGFWKCSPRRVSLTEWLQLSWTKGPVMPFAAYFSEWKVSRKKPRESEKTRGRDDQHAREGSGLDVHLRSLCFTSESMYCP